MNDTYDKPKKTKPCEKCEAYPSEWSALLENGMHLCRTCHLRHLYYAGHYGRDIE